MAPKTDIATRAFVVSLKAPCNGKTIAEIIAITGLPKGTINGIYARAIARWFDPNQRPLIIRNCYLEDAPRSGRAIKRTEEAKTAVLGKVRRDRYGREKSCADIAGKLGLEGSTYQLLQSGGFSRQLASTRPSQRGSLD